MRDKKERRNIYMRDSIYEKAQAIMRARDTDNFSEFLSQLIREEHDRRAAAKAERQSQGVVKHSGGGRAGGIS